MSDEVVIIECEALEKCLKYLEDDFKIMKTYISASEKGRRFDYSILQDAKQAMGRTEWLFSKFNSKEFGIEKTILQNLYKARYGKELRRLNIKKDNYSYVNDIREIEEII